MTASAFAEERFKLAECTPHYSECLERTGPYCQDGTANVPTPQRTTAMQVALPNIKAPVERTSATDATDESVRGGSNSRP